MELNPNQKRILLGGGIALLVLSAILLVLEKNALVLTAYFFGLIAIIEFFGTLWLLSTGTKNKYITNVAFPLMSQHYLFSNLGISALFVGLQALNVWTIPVGWFAILHILLTAFFVWKLLAMDAGREAIEHVEIKVKAKVLNWKSILVDVDAIRENATPNSLKSIDAVRDAIRYADPMTDDSLAQNDDAIKDNVILLEQFVADQKETEVAALCVKLQRQIKDRNNRVKLLK